MRRLNQSGISILETIIAIALSIAVITGLMSVFNQQTKQTNYGDFRAKIIQTRLALLSQVLSNPNNCKCMFQGASNFPDTGTAELTGFTQPSEIGRYINPDCSGSPAIMAPVLTTTEKDGIALESMELKRITFAAGIYTGDLQIKVKTSKKVVGISEVMMQIPVNISVAPVSPGMVGFSSCNVTSAEAAGSTLQGEVIGAPIVLNFNTVGTRNNVYPLSSYSGATHLHFECWTHCRDNNSRSFMNITFRTSGTPIFRIAACQPGEINNDNTAHDRNAALMPIPTLADEIYVERVIQSGCGNRRNDSTIRFFK